MIGPKKYSCSICGKQFRRKKQHFNHVMRGHKDKNQGTKKQVVVPQVEPELVSLKDPIIHTEPHPLDHEYFGAPYDYGYPGLLTGNSHLRCGLPFLSDPLRRIIQPRVLPKAMPSLGPVLALSKHKYGAQAI